MMLLAYSYLVIAVWLAPLFALAAFNAGRGRLAILSVSCGLLWPIVFFVVGVLAVIKKADIAEFLQH